MKFIFVIILLWTILRSSVAVGFLRDIRPFGVRGGGRHEHNIPEDEEYERAEQAILDAVTKVEEKVQQVVAKEVDTLFHGRETKKELAEKARQVVAKGAQNVKQSVKEFEAKHVYPFEDHPYPFSFPQADDKFHPHEHKDHRILRAMENAEKALVHAIEQEVETIFHDNEHQEQKKVVKEGIQKASSDIKEEHKNRRNWLSGEMEALIENYIYFSGI